MPADTPQVSIIAANWNGREDVLRLLHSLAALDYPKQQLEVIIHDNASTDGSADAIEAEMSVMRAAGWRKLALLRAEVDPCLCEALQKCYKACSPDSEFVLRFDNDAAPPANAVRELVGTMRRFPRAGVVGCKVVSINNPSELHGAGRLINWWGFLGTWIDPLEVSPCDYVPGAAIMARRSVVEQVGMFVDPSLYIYQEESDFCMRVHALGYDVLYTPGVVVQHVGHISRGERAEVIGFFIYRNTILFMRRYNRNVIKRWTAYAITVAHAAKMALLHGDWPRLQGAVSGLLGLRFGEREWLRLSGQV
jgi:GT2 family glycosyltransferase